MNSNQMQSTTARRQRALANPARVYGQPMEVLIDPALDDTTRRQVLEGWALDERRLMAATGENMAGGRAHRLGAVMSAMRLLEGTADDRRAGMVQGGNGP